MVRVQRKSTNTEHPLDPNRSCELAAFLAVYYILGGAASEIPALDASPHSGNAS